jgi:hypothetical protein
LAGFLEHKWLKRHEYIGVWENILGNSKSLFTFSDDVTIENLKNRPLCLKTYGGLGPGLRRGDEFFDVSFSISSAT